jgi:Aspartyl protease
MPWLTLPTTGDGFALSVLVGLNGMATTSLLAAGGPVPPPIPAGALVDTGTNVTCVAAPILRRLGLLPITSRTTQTAGGTMQVDLYEVSLSVLGPLGILFINEHLVVMELSQPPEGVEVLVGRDLLSEWFVVIDGRAQQFTLAF